MFWRKANWICLRLTFYINGNHKSYTGWLKAQNLCSNESCANVIRDWQRSSAHTNVHWLNLTRNRKTKDDKAILVEPKLASEIIAILLTEINLGVYF